MDCYQKWLGSWYWFHGRPTHTWPGPGWWEEAGGYQNLGSVSAPAFHLASSPTPFLCRRRRQENHGSPSAVDARRFLSSFASSWFISTTENASRGVSYWDRREWTSSDQSIDFSPARSTELKEISISVEIKANVKNPVALMPELEQYTSPNSTVTVVDRERFYLFPVSLHNSNSRGTST